MHAHAHHSLHVCFHTRRIHRPAGCTGDVRVMSCTTILFRSRDKKRHQHRSSLLQDSYDLDDDEAFSVVSRDHGRRALLQSHRTRLLPRRHASERGLAWSSFSFFFLLFFSCFCSLSCSSFVFLFCPPRLLSLLLLRLSFCCLLLRLSFCCVLLLLSLCFLLVLGGCGLGPLLSRIGLDCRTSLRTTNQRRSFLPRPNLVHRVERSYRSSSKSENAACFAAIITWLTCLRLALRSFGLRLLDALGEVLLDVSYLVLRVNA